MNRIDNYWNNFFGININEINEETIRVVTHKKLSGFHGLWIFKRGRKVIISVPETLRLELQKHLSLFDPHKCTIEEFIIQFLDHKVERIIGSAFQGYIEEQIKITSPKGVKKLGSTDDRQVLNDFFAREQGLELEHSSISPDQENIFGIIEENKLLAISGYSLKERNVAFIGVYTSKRVRGKGLAKKVVFAAIKDALEKNLLILYQTLCANKASMQVAKDLGIIEFGQHTAIRLKPENL